jgi:hypothetical protein
VPPNELFETNNDAEVGSDVFRNVDPNGLSESDLKKANKEAKKLATKQAKQNDKSKQKKLTVKNKYEKMLADRTMAQLRPLNPAVCIALGFPELRPMQQNDAKGSQLSLALSQLSSQKKPKIADSVSILLFHVLNQTLKKLLSNKHALPFKSDGNSSDDFVNDSSNPYGLDKTATVNEHSNVLLATCDSSQRECFAFLSTLHEGDVFCSMFEHLAALAGLRSSSDDVIDVNGLEERILEAAIVVFNCIATIVGSNKLTRTSTGISTTHESFLFLFPIVVSLCHLFYRTKLPEHYSGSYFSRNRWTYTPNISYQYCPVTQGPIQLDQ